MSRKTCAYCGVPVGKRQKEHVFPKCLYPLSKRASKVQRLTIPACARCNQGWADDEAHFRNMLLVSGEPNPAVRELWETKAIPSFYEVDGPRRIKDLWRQMKQVKTEQGERYAVYPGEDERVMRVARKAIRGLCHYHQVMSPVSDRRVWADVLRYEIPQELLKEMEYHHREKGIVEYRYQVLNDPLIHSVWLLTFFERRTFIGMVSTSEDGFPEQDGWA